jgi:predicted SAM-dependent methyltransferase
MEKALKLHLGCGEKYLEGYVNIDYPDTEQSVIKTKADVISDMRSLSYPEGTVDEIRSHHLFEHFSRAEALKLLVRWKSWLKPGGLLVIETPDFTASSALFVTTTSMRRKFQLARHIFGSEEAGWATHKDYWDKEKFAFVLKKMGFTDFTARGYRNGLAKHAKEAPKIGSTFKKLPERVYLPFLNALGNILPESFYKKYGGNKMPNILVTARKDVRVNMSKADEDRAAKELLAMSMAGREGDALLDVWFKDYTDF